MQTLHHINQPKLKFYNLARGMWIFFLSFPALRLSIRFVLLFFGVFDSTFHLTPDSASKKCDECHHCVIH